MPLYLDVLPPTVSCFLSFPSQLSSLCPQTGVKNVKDRENVTSPQSPPLGSITLAIVSWTAVCVCYVMLVYIPFAGVPCRFVVFYVL